MSSGLPSMTVNASFTASCDGALAPSPSQLSFRLWQERSSARSLDSASRLIAVQPIRYVRAQSQRHNAPHFFGNGMMLPGSLVGSVRNFIWDGGPSPAAFFCVTRSSYSVSGNKSTKLQLFNGVSKPGLHSSAPASRMRMTVVVPGRQLASTVLP